MNADFLSSDSDALDRFIERKLKEAGHGVKDSKIKVFLNPSDDYMLKEGEGVILILWNMIIII